MFTHTVLFATLSPDDLEERGPISREEAIELFRSFPFEEELTKREGNADLTVPTLTFTAEADGSSLTIWSADPGEFLIWVPAIFGLAGGVTDPEDVADCVDLFFDSDLETLGIRLIRLEEKYS